MERKNYELEQCECSIVHESAVARARASMPDEESLCEVAELFKVFGDSTRARIISALLKEELCVCDIASLLGMTKSAVSHQLRILRQTKIVKNRRSGKEVYYSLDDCHIEEIFNTALAHLMEE